MNLQDYGTNALKQYGFIRVPENFRVIAMGSTIPKNLHVLPDSSNERGLQANEINYSVRFIAWHFFYSLLTVMTHDTNDYHI